MPNFHNEFNLSPIIFFNSFSLLFCTYCNIERRAIIFIDIIIIIIISVINIIIVIIITVILRKKNKLMLKIHSVVVNKRQFPPLDVTVHKTRECILNAEYTISEKLRAASFFT